MSSEILAARTTSAFPLSIGTSLAFESLSESGGQPYDPERKIPQIVDLSQYQEFWINLSTLFRNMWSSVPSADAEKLQARDCAEALLIEMDVIEEIIKLTSSDRLKVVFYISNYKNLKSLNSIAQVRIPNTEKQQHYYKVHDKAIQEILNIRHARQQDVLIFERNLQPKDYPKCLIFSHMGYDLISFPKFKTLELIESHTGILKKRDTWYTKFYQSEDLMVIPFIEKTIKIFGDSHTFRAMPIKVRKTILELAIQKRWMWATTQAKVLQDVEGLKDQFLAQQIKAL